MEHQRLVEEFDALLKRHSEEQKELADKFCVKPEYLDKLRGSSTHYKPKRAANIENAKIHMKSIEINKGIFFMVRTRLLGSFLILDREVGDRVRMKELRQMVKDDPKLQDLSNAEEEDLQNELLASRAEKRLGARPTNRSAAQDYRRCLMQINDEVCKTAACVLWYLVLTDSKISALSERTGVAAVCFFSRTHLEDSFEPNWICSPNASNFTEDSLGWNMWDIT